jgi:hypothetical protein
MSQHREQKTLPGFQQGLFSRDILFHGVSSYHLLASP